MATSAFLLIAQFVNKKKMEFPANLTFVFGLCAFGMSGMMTFGSVFGYDELSSGGSKLLCNCQGVLAQFFSVGLVCWWSAISLNLYIGFIRIHPPALSLSLSHTFSRSHHKRRGGDEWESISLGCVANRRGCDVYSRHV